MNYRSRKLFTVSTLAFLTLLFFQSAFAFEPGKEARTVVVSGHGSVEAAPDMARVFIGVTQAGNDLDAVTASVKSTTYNVMSALKTAGVLDKEIQTHNYSIIPRLHWDADGIPQTVGYTVTNEIKVTISDVKRVGAILSAALKAGANQLNGPQFDFNDRKKYEREALGIALADAKAKATILAQGADAHLGSPFVIEEGNSELPPPRPMMGAMMMAKAASPEPVSAGTETVSANVTVAYSLIVTK